MSDSQPFRDVEADGLFVDGECEGVGTFEIYTDRFALTKDASVESYVSIYLNLCIQAEFHSAQLNGV